MDAAKPLAHHVTAKAHFGVGILIVLAAAFLSNWIHDNSMLRDLQMLNLDALFLSHVSPEEMKRVVVVPIKEDDYHNPKLFAGKSPLNVAIVQNLIVACARSGARVIGVDLDTSAWTVAEREELARKLAAAGSSSRIVWAVGAWMDPATGKLTAQPLEGVPNGQCEALPASVPDRFGVVRGYLRALELEENGKSQAQPGMAVVVANLETNPNSECAPPGAPQSAALPSEIEDKQLLVNFSSAGPGPVQITAASLLGAVEGEAWRRSNPLRDHAALIGGSFSEARDKYVTPAGYLDGVDILARSVVSVDKGITQAKAALYLPVDLSFGLLLLIATWRLHRAWALLLSFVMIPLIGVGVSYWLFHAYGVFASFVPVVFGVLLHHLLEHAWEHGRLIREVRYLKQKLSEGSSLPT